MGMAFNLDQEVTYGEFAEQLGQQFNTVRVRLYRKKNFSPKKKERVPQEIADFLLQEYGAGIVQTQVVQPDQPTEMAPELPETTTANAMPMQAAETASKAGFWAKFGTWFKALTYADAIIFIICMFTTYGLITLFHLMGAGLATLYWLVSFWVLDMVKDQNRTGTAQTGVGFMWVLSFAAIYVHVSMFNNEIWAQADRMLFRPQPGDSAPFWTALVLGVFFFAVEIFAFESKRSETLETAE